jgi:hypothetical protein
VTGRPPVQGSPTERGVSVISKPRQKGGSLKLSSHGKTMPVVLYGCKNGPLPLREEYRLRAF